MNIIKWLTKILLGFYLLFSLNSCFLGGDTGVEVEILNNFTQPLVVEVWTGDHLRYAKGEIRGKNLKNNLTLTTVTNLGVDNSTFVNIGDDRRSVLVILGTDEGVDGYWYLADEVINNLDHYNTPSNNYSVTVEIDTSGNISVY